MYKEEVVLAPEEAIMASFIKSSELSLQNVKIIVLRRRDLDLDETDHMVIEEVAVNSLVIS